MKNILLSDFLAKYIKETIISNNITNYSKDDILRVVAFTLKQNKNSIYTNLNSTYIDETVAFDIKSNLDKLYINNIPLQYILGIQPFYNEEYIVNENVLIPRADTEILVETAIEYIYRYNLKSMLDLCSGSGCIGISTLNNSSIESCVFVDISKEVLNVTNQNIIHNKVSKKVLTINSNLFENVNDKFDLILSNPPYIPTKEIASLNNDVQNEPHLALDGGEDGLDIYRRILNEASKYLNDGGYLILEIGYNQLDDLIELIKNSDLDFIESLKDLGNNDRVVVCHFHQK